MKSPKAEVNLKAKRRNHHLLVDPGCSSHLLNQQVDDHHKRERDTRMEHTTNKTER